MNGVGEGIDKVEGEERQDSEPLVQCRHGGVSCHGHRGRQAELCMQSICPGPGERKLINPVHVSPLLVLHVGCFGSLVEYSSCLKRCC